MSIFLEALKKKIYEIERSEEEKGKTPLSVVYKNHLDENNTTVEEFIKYVNPCCTIIFHNGIVTQEDKLYKAGVPEGSLINVIMLVGHDEVTKNIMWRVYESEETLYDEEYFLNQLLLYMDTNVVRSKVCLATDSGPVFEETTY